MQMIAYYRVSTVKQGQSGLGLDAQRMALEKYADQESATVVAEYQEVESGKLADRPQLINAIAHAKRSQGKLVVAKLDRLDRSVLFLSALMESGVDFTAVDNPHANRFTLHILAALAEHESYLISERTKHALAALKAKGVKLGSARDGHWDGHGEARLQGAKKGGDVAAIVHRQAAQDAYADLCPIIRQLRDDGESFRQIAKHLNNEGHTTRRGKPWNATQVMRVFKSMA